MYQKLYIRTCFFNNCSCLQENIFDSLLTNDDKLKNLCENSQSSHQPNTVSVVTNKRNLKFGNSVSAEWIEDDQLSITDVYQRDE